MKRFDVLDPTTNIRGVHLLEASAGTGKTFAIEHLVARLLLEGDAPLSIDQILVMTFTNAATRELKIRIRTTLEKIEDVLLKKKDFSRKDYLFSLLDAGEESRKTTLKRVEEALASFSSAQIFTIHGFCHRMLSELAFEANVPFGIRDAEAKGYKTELHSLVKDFFRTDLSLMKYSPRQLEILLRKHKHDVNQLTSKLGAVLEKNTEISPRLSFDQVLSEIQSLLLEGKGKYRAKSILEDFSSLSGCYKKMGTSEILAQVEKFARIVESGDCSAQDLDALLQDKEFFLEGMEISNQKVRAKFPEKGSLHYSGLFEQMRKVFLPLIREAKDSSSVFLRLAKDCQIKMKQHALKEERMHPDELLNKMQKALSNPAFLTQARSKIKAAIIDEFQDTDPVQWNLFSTLFLSPEQKMTAVYLVGDPKQSIYAFRSADLYTYLNAKNILGGDRFSFLDTNFRSEPDLVEALNILFSTGKEAEWMRLPFLNQTIAYPPVKAAPEAKNQEIHDDRGSVHFFLHEESRGREKSWPSLSQEENLLFPSIAKEILLLHEQLHVEYGKIAILIKDRFQEQRLFEFLKKANIPASVRKKSALSETLSFAVMKELIEAVNDPADFCKVKKVLAGPLFSWPHQNLKKTSENSELAKASGRFFGWQQKLQKKGYGSFFHEILLEKGPEKTILEHLLSLEDLSLYFDLRHLADLLIEQEKDGLSSCEELLFYLKGQEFEAVDEDERGRLFKEEEEQKVILLTTHASKGLEFDFVFALGIAYRHSSSETWVRVKKGSHEQIEALDLNDESTLLALAELDAEKMRQLYVALTRARRRVYIPFIMDANEAILPLGQASPIELFMAHHFPLQEKINLSLANTTALLDELGKNGLITYSRLEELPSITKGAAVRSSPILEAPPEILFSLYEERIFSFSSLALSSSEESLKKEALELNVKSPHTLPLGKETGIILHHLLEKIIQNQWHSPFQEKKVKNFLLNEMEGSTLQGWEETLFTILQKTFSLTLNTTQDSFCLADVSPSSLQQEMEFLLPLQGVFLKGFIDLVFQIKGKYYLLDWKSNWLGPDQNSYTLQNVEKSMKEHDYFLQAAIYAKALQHYVKLFDMRPFEECFGGAFYLFLRAGIAYHFVPDLTILDQLDHRIAEGGKKWEE